MPSRPPFDWKESRRWNIEALGELRKGCQRSEGLIRHFDGAEYIVGGDEHLLLRSDDEPTRIFKTTYADSFGCRTTFDPIDHEGSGRHFLATLNDDPRFYIRRWIILNGLGGHLTRYEGILPPEKPHWAPRICISQPWIDGPTPGLADIERAMRAYGYLPVSEHAYFQPTTKVLLTDAAPRNVRLWEDGPIPFDAIAEIASPEIEEWIACR